MPIVASMRSQIIKLFQRNQKDKSLVKTNDSASINTNNSGNLEQQTSNQPFYGNKIRKGSSFFRSIRKKFARSNLPSESSDSEVTRRESIICFEKVSAASIEVCKRYCGQTPSYRNNYGKAQKHCNVDNIGSGRNTTNNNRHSFIMKESGQSVLSVEPSRERLIGGTSSAFASIGTFTSPSCDPSTNTNVSNYTIYKACESLEKAKVVVSEVNAEHKGLSFEKTKMGRNTEFTILENKPSDNCGTSRINHNETVFSTGNKKVSSDVPSRPSTGISPTPSSANRRICNKTASSDGARRHKVM